MYIIFTHSDVEVWFCLFYVSVDFNITIYELTMLYIYKHFTIFTRVFVTPITVLLPHAGKQWPGSPFISIKGWLVGSLLNNVCNETHPVNEENIII